MEPIYADYSVSMTEFNPKVFGSLVEDLADRDLLEVARRRLAHKDTAYRRPLFCAPILLH